MRKIQTKVELHLEMTDMRDRFRQLRGAFSALQGQIVEASITMQRLNEAFETLAESEVTSELIQTETTVNSKVAWWVYVACFLSLCALLYSIYYFIK